MACSASGGNSDGDALFADFAVPGFWMRVNQLVGGRVSGAAKKDGDEEVMDGLGRGEVPGGARADVAGLEIGDGGDGERDAGAGDAHVDFDGPVEVETGLGVVPPRAVGLRQEWQAARTHALDSLRNGLK